MGAKAYYELTEGEQEEKLRAELGDAFVSLADVEEKIARSVSNQRCWSTKELAEADPTELEDDVLHRTQSEADALGVLRTTSPARVLSFQAYENAPRWDDKQSDEKPFWQEFEVAKLEIASPPEPMEISCAYETLRGLRRRARKLGGDERDEREARVVFRRFFVSVYGKEKVEKFLEAYRAKPADWLRPGERLAADPVAALRVATGLQTLDEVTRGGLPEGNVVVLMAPPELGKSAFALQVANRAEEQGFAVVILAPDSGPEAVEVRLGQMMGFDREKLEDRDPETIAALGDAFFARRIWIPDPYLLTERGWTANTVEAIAEKASKMWPDVPIMLVIDSIQKAIPDSQKHGSEREKNMAVMNQAKIAAASKSFLVLMISQVNRATYRSKTDSENADPLAGGSETSAIEYTAEILMFLSGDPTTPEGVEAPGP